jgi:hypothetical protein
VSSQRAQPGSNNELLGNRLDTGTNIITLRFIDPKIGEKFIYQVVECIFSHMVLIDERAFVSTLDNVFVL